LEERDPGTVALPSNNDFWKLSGKTCTGSGKGTATGGSTNQGTGQASGLTSQQSALSEVITRHQGESADAGFSSFLTDFAKVMENLN